MSANAVWTNKRSEARPNEYVGLCKTCGNSVEKEAGFLVSHMSIDGAALSHGSLHAFCPLPAGTPSWRLRAKFGVSGMLRSEVIDNADDFNQEAADAKAESEAAEAPKAPEPPRDPTEAELEAIARKLLSDNTEAFLKLVPDLVRKTMHEACRTVEVKVPKAKPVKFDNAHRLMPTILKAVTAGVKPMIVGPAGSGKSTLCEQVAEALGLKFYMANSVAGKHELLGFRDAHGKPVHTDFYKAFKTGGLFLFDEADNSNPNALVALNSALANGFCEFAGEIVRAHKDFRCVAATNTFGRGADMMYVGRNKLDAATLDRFPTFIMDYDEEAELAWAGNDEWTKYVQSIRKVVFAEKINHVVSPRASIEGAKLLAAELDWNTVAEACIWKGLDNTQRSRIKNRLAQNILAGAQS